MEIFLTFLAKNYEMETKLGTGVTNDVQVRSLVDNVCRDNFDQKKHEHLLTSASIEKLMRAAAESFVKLNYVAIAKGEKVLTADEVSGARLLLGLNATNLAASIGLSKGTISKILRGTMTLKRPESILLMERMIQEITNPGSWNKAAHKPRIRHRRKADVLRHPAA